MGYVHSTSFAALPINSFFFISIFPFIFSQFILLVHIFQKMHQLFTIILVFVVVLPLGSAKLIIVDDDNGCEGHICSSSEVCMRDER
jgi:hypothetical protein